MDRVTACLARLLILFLYLPIVAVIVLSFDDSDVTSSWTHPSLRWFRSLLHDGELHSALRVTLTVAIAAATVSTVVGLLAASALTRFAFRQGAY